MNRVSVTSAICSWSRVLKTMNSSSQTENADSTQFQTSQTQSTEVLELRQTCSFKVNSYIYQLETNSCRVPTWQSSLTCSFMHVSLKMYKKMSHTVWAVDKWAAFGLFHTDDMFIFAVKIIFKNCCDLAYFWNQLQGETASFKASILT